MKHNPSDGPHYSNNDFAAIAAAVRVDVCKVTQHRAEFGQASFWYAATDTGLIPSVAVIGAALENGVTLIEVADTGPGVAPAAREKLFEAFAGLARAGGTGLGLAIARDLMHAHRGDITLLRSDAKSTVFRLELPDQ